MFLNEGFQNLYYQVIKPSFILKIRRTHEGLMTAIDFSSYYILTQFLDFITIE